MTINVTNDAMLGTLNDKSLGILLIEQQQKIDKLEEENERLQLELDNANSTASKYAKRCIKVAERINKINKKHVIDLNYELEWLLQIVEGKDDENSNKKDN